MLLSVFTVSFKFVLLRHLFSKYCKRLDLSHRGTRKHVIEQNTTFSPYFLRTSPGPLKVHATSMMCKRTPREFESAKKSFLKLQKILSFI